MRQKGIAQIAVLLALILLVVAVSAASYYILKNMGKVPTTGIVPVSYFTPAPTPAGVSDSDDPSVIESELDATNLDSVEGDLNNLETSASSL